MARFEKVLVPHELMSLVVTQDRGRKHKNYIKEQLKEQLEENQRLTEHRSLNERKIDKSDPSDKRHSVLDKGHKRHANCLHAFSIRY